MRQVLILFILIFFALSVYANTPQASNTDLSFFLSGTSAQLVKASGGQYQLTISGVSPYIHYLAARPNRNSGLAQISNFISAWQVGGNSSFANVNPNGVLYAGVTNNETSDDSSQVYPVQITNPQYDQETQTFRCTLQPLGQQSFLFDNIVLQQVLLVVN